MNLGVDLLNQNLCPTWGMLDANLGQTWYIGETFGQTWDKVGADLDVVETDSGV